MFFINIIMIPPYSQVSSHHFSLVVTVSTVNSRSCVAEDTKRLEVGEIHRDQRLLPVAT